MAEMIMRRFFALLVAGCVALECLAWAGLRCLNARPEPPSFPAWVSDHVGKPRPEFASGDECLFCHRTDIGPGWRSNRHGQTVRPADSESAAIQAVRAAEPLKGLAAEIELVMGGANRVRFLKPGKESGTLELLSAAWTPPAAGRAAAFVMAEAPRWDQKRFGDACAGCHASGADSFRRTFLAQSLDCFVCHGDVPEAHTKDPALVHLSPRRMAEPRVISSICGQCHVRTGTSRSTGLTYANNFVAGDNLFLDFQVDLSEGAIRRLNPGDGHVLANLRDVLLLGKESVTCLTCHEIHRQSSRKHRIVPRNDGCLFCHHAAGPKKEVKAYEVHSNICGY